MNHGILDGTLVRVCADGGACFSIRTFSRQYKRSSRFLIVKKRFAAWLAEGSGTYYDEDIYNFVEVRLRNDQVIFNFTWLSGDSHNLFGHREHISVPISIIMDALFYETVEKTHLYYDASRPPRFDFSGAHERLCESIAQKKVRRALSKALSKIGWIGASFRVFDDFVKHSFFFRADGICGGIILHKDTHKNDRGEFPKVYYGMHT